MKIKENKKSIKVWCEALRSGKYRQGIGSLQSEEGYCCLGVACYIFIPERQKEYSMFGELKGLTPHHQENAPVWLKQVNLDFRDLMGVELAALNDKGIDSLSSFTFDEIVDLIEAVYIHEVLN